MKKVFFMLLCAVSFSIVNAGVPTKVTKRGGKICPGSTSLVCFSVIKSDVSDTKRNLTCSGNGVNRCEFQVSIAGEDTEHLNAIIAAVDAQVIGGTFSGTDTYSAGGFTATYTWYDGENGATNGIGYILDITPSE